MFPPSIFAWTASFMYGAEGIIGKLISKYSISDALLFNFVWSVLTFVLMVPVALFFGAGMPHEWPSLVGASVFSAIGGLTYVLALYKLDISIVAPLYSFRVAITALLGAVFLAEILTFSQYVFIAIIFICGLFVSIDERYSVRSFFTLGSAIAIMSMLALALMAVFTKVAVMHTNFWTVALWIQGLHVVWSCLTIPFFKRSFASIKAKQYAAVTLISLADVVATVAAVKAYSINVSIATAIISLPFSMLGAIFCAVFFPHLLERHKPKVYLIRLASATIMFLAALQLS